MLGSSAGVYDTGLVLTGTCPSRALLLVALPPPTLALCSPVICVVASKLASVNAVVCSLSYLPLPKCLPPLPPPLPPSCPRNPRPAPGAPSFGGGCPALGFSCCCFCHSSFLGQLKWLGLWWLVLPHAGQGGLVGLPSASLKVLLFSLLCQFLCWFLPGSVSIGVLAGVWGLLLWWVLVVC